MVLLVDDKANRDAIAVHKLALCTVSKKEIGHKGGGKSNSPLPYSLSLLFSSANSNTANMKLS